MKTIYLRPSYIVNQLSIYKLYITDLLQLIYYVINRWDWLTPYNVKRTHVLVELISNATYNF